MAHILYCCFKEASPHHTSTLPLQSRRVMMFLITFFDGLTGYSFIVTCSFNLCCKVTLACKCMHTSSVQQSIVASCSLCMHHACVTCYTCIILSMVHISSDVYIMRRVYTHDAWFTRLCMINNHDWVYSNCWTTFNFHVHCIHTRYDTIMSVLLYNCSWYKN